MGAVGWVQDEDSGAMVCDSHHVPSTRLEALVVVSRCGIVGLEELVPVSPASRVHDLDDLTIGNGERRGVIRSESAP